VYKYVNENQPNSTEYWRSVLHISESDNPWSWTSFYL